MKLKNDDIRMAIATIFTNKAADYAVTNEVLDPDYGRCVEFRLHNISTTITAGLEQDYWSIARVFSDRKETVEYRGKGRFLDEVGKEADRSAKKRAACDIAERHKGCCEEGKAAAQGAKALGEAPNQFTPSEAVAVIERIILDHSIANAKTDTILGEAGGLLKYEITFTSWGMPVLVTVDADTVLLPKIEMYTNYSDCPLLTTNGKGGYTEPRAFRWFMGAFDQYLTRRDIEQPAGQDALMTLSHK